MLSQVRCKILPKHFVRRFSESQESNQDVLLRIFIRQESLPTAIGHVVTTNELNLRKVIDVD